MGHRLVAVLVFFGFVGSCCVQAASVAQKKAEDVRIEALLENETVRDLLADIYGEEDIEGNGDWVKVCDKAFYFALYCKREAVPALVAAGMDPDGVFKDGRTFLMQAAIEEDKEVVNLLLDNGASIDKIDGKGRTALMYAAIQNKFLVVNLLLDKGASIDKIDGEGRTALMHAAIQNNVNVVHFLLNNDVDMAARDGCGKTALMIAARYGNIDVVKKLLKAGACTNLFDFKNRTALDLSVFYKNVEIQKLLREKGAKTFAELSSAGDQKDPSEVISSAPAAQPVAADPLAIPHSSVWSSLPSSRVIVLFGLAASLAAALYVWHYHPSNAAPE